LRSRSLRHQPSLQSLVREERGSLAAISVSPFSSQHLPPPGQADLPACLLWHRAVPIHSFERGIGPASTHEARFSLVNVPVLRKGDNGEAVSQFNASRSLMTNALLSPLRRCPPYRRGVSRPSAQEVDDNAATALRMAASTLPFCQHTLHNLASAMPRMTVRNHSTDAVHHLFKS